MWRAGRRHGGPQGSAPGPVTHACAVLEDEEQGEEEQDDAGEHLGGHPGLPSRLRDLDRPLALPPRSPSRAAGVGQPPTAGSTSDRTPVF
jgi:hypothetical protein